MAIRFITVAILVTLAGASLAQNKVFQDVERGHWAYAELKLLHKAGLTAAAWADPNGYFNSRHTFTRYEFAVAIDRCLHEVGLRTYEKPLSKAPRHALTPQIATSLLRLVREFEEELRAFGVDVPKVRQQLQATSRPPAPPGSRPFSDVPPDHWAFHAVESLRQKGIMRGYPDGTFNGPAR